MIFGVVECLNCHPLCGDGRGQEERSDAKYSNASPRDFYFPVNDNVIHSSNK